MSDRCVLVTGGAGYIGSFTVRALLKGGFQPIVIDNLCTGFRNSIPDGVPFFLADVTDFKSVAQLIQQFKVRSVMHFAAHLVVPESVSDPIKYYQNNLMGTLQLLKACAQEKVSHFVFSSTAAVYGNTQKTPVSEEETPQPESPYGWSKLMSEQILKDFSKSHSWFSPVIFRYFNVAGASIDMTLGQRTKNASHLIKVVCEAAIGKRDKITVFGFDYSTADGTCVRDYIHVEDLAQAHVLGLEYLLRGGRPETFNLGYGKGFSVLEVVKALQNMASRTFKVELGARRLGDAVVVVADAQKAKQHLGWTPGYEDLNIICKTSLEWEKHLLKES